MAPKRRGSSRRSQITKLERPGSRDAMEAREDRGSCREKAHASCTLTVVSSILVRLRIHI